MTASVRVASRDLPMGSGSKSIGGSARHQKRRHEGTWEGRQGRGSRQAPQRTQSIRERIAGLLNLDWFWGD